MVHVNKPAQVREDPITDKTGGCNNDAGSIGKSCNLPARKGNGVLYFVFQKSMKQLSQHIAVG